MDGLAGRYSILIEWSDADHAYIATVEELDRIKIHGETRAEALTKAEDLIAAWLETETDPPAPRQFDRHYAAEGQPWVEAEYDPAVAVGL